MQNCAPWLEASAVLDAAPNAGMAWIMIFFDTILRFPAITLLFLLSVLAFRDARDLVQGRIVVILGLTLGSMLMSTAPPETRPPSPFL